MAHNFVNDVSDTAYWIAGFRAQESERPDAVFKDKYAGLLAGEKGIRMVEETPAKEAMAFAMVVRTAAIDELVYLALRQGADAVINIGAGLDTRPYRLNLPKDLHWIEIDFKSTVDYKNRLLAKEIPNCMLERIAADLSDDVLRRQLFRTLGKRFNKALIITEGVIGYLSNQEAENLSKDLYAVPSFALWIQDYSRGKMRRKASRKVEEKVQARAPIKFDVEEPIAFFAQHGWRVKENRYILDEADRLGKKFPLFFPWSILLKLFPKLIRKMGNSTYGYVLLEKA